MNQTIRPLRFGHLSIWPPFVAAPIAGYTDGIYREILRESGCPFCYTEMISARGLVLGGQATLALLEHSAKDRPLAVQLFGSDPDDMFNAVQKIHQPGAQFDAIDINMGCPARKITSQGAGGALLRDIPKAVEIVQAVKSASGLPVSVKMRIGWANGAGAVEIASRLQDAGADMLAVHGRTVAQGYGGKANWDEISRIAASVSIPTVGNGDVTSPCEGIGRLHASGCSGIMIGRGILGNPFFFTNLNDLLRGRESEPQGHAERIKMARVHLNRAAARYGKHHATLELKKHLVFYFKGMKGASRLRVAINNANSLSELVDAIDLFSAQFSGSKRGQ